MSLELLNTIATLATCAIIATTAIAALVQLRHMRASNQIAGQLAIRDLILGAEFMRAEMTIRGLPAMIGDPAYAWAFRVPATKDLPQEVIEMRAAARIVGSNFENVGNMVRHGLTDGRLFIEQYGNVVLRAWELLEPFTLVQRKLAPQHDRVWEDFELLAVLCRDWEDRHKTAFEHRRRLLPPHEEIVLPPAPEPAER